MFHFALRGGFSASTIAGFQMTLSPETGCFPIPFLFTGLFLETLMRLADGATIASRPQFPKPP
jgi:hypothetical protein